MARLVETLYRRAISIREAALGANSPQLAATLSNLSVFITNSKDPLTSEHIDEAEYLLKRGLTIRRHVFGDQHCEVAHSNHLPVCTQHSMPLTAAHCVCYR